MALRIDRSTSAPVLGDWLEPMTPAARIEWVRWLLHPVDLVTGKELAPFITEKQAREMLEPNT